MIRFERATVERGGHVVVEELSLQVLPGQSLALIGRSGAGKSSLLAATATALPLHAGDVMVDGHSLRRDPDLVRQAVGYVPSRMPEWPGIRVGEFLELAVAQAGRGGLRLRDRVDRALGVAGLTARGHEPLDALDDGHAKRLLVARALVHDPPVLVLDDPFGGLDPPERRDMERLIGDAHLMGRTVLAAVDDGRVPACFTHLAVLRDGRLVDSGPADPALLGGGRRFTYRIACRSQAAEAEQALRGCAADVRPLDLDSVEATIDPAVVPPARLLAALVAAGVAVEAAGFEPPWTAQLLE